MSPSRAILEELDDQDAAAAAEAGRARRADYLRTAVACIAWAGCGIFGVAWGAHTSDETLGTAAFYVGVGAGNGGVIFTLLAAYRRGERRGDW